MIIAEIVAKDTISEPNFDKIVKSFSIGRLYNQLEQKIK